MSVLIVTKPDDADALVVKMALDKLGENCVIFYPNDFSDNAEWSMEIGSDVLKTKYRDIEFNLNLNEYATVWMRRPASIIPREKLADERERMSAEAESASFVNSIYRILGSKAFTVNQLNSSRVSQEKCYQFEMAKSVGFEIPPTLISNSKNEICSFYERFEGGIVYKPLFQMLWDANGKGYSAVFTTEINDKKLLLDSDLVSAPAIYQKTISKVAELRVIVLGCTVIAIKKSFPERDESQLDVDWRTVHKGAVYTKHSLSEDMEAKCIKLLKKLNLVMGVFDLVLDNDGSVFFLEVNEQGQFIWLEQECPEANLLEAFCHFLISKNPNFEYKRKDEIKLADFNDREVFKELYKQECQIHYGELHSFRYATKAVKIVETVEI